MPGLLSCPNFDEYYCIVRLVEVLIAGLLIGFCMAEIIITIKMERRLVLKTPLAIIILLLLSLVFNFVHIMVAYEKIKILLYLQSYFVSNFFLTIFYYVGDNVLNGRKQRIALHIFYVILILVYTAILIFRSIQETITQCSQTFYMIIDALTSLVSILVLALYCKKNMEQKKMERFYSSNFVNKTYHKSSNFNSPFIRMWILISTNIFCGLVNLTQTAILYAAFNDTCLFTQNLNLNTLINFVFIFFGYYLGSFVTLLVLHRIRVVTMESQNALTYSHSSSMDTAEGNKLELIVQMSSRSSTY